jgi:ketosteroid isomerase-like protein
MTTPTTLDLEALVQATRDGGAAALADHVADDVELVQIDAHTPPARPAIHRGRETLLTLAEDLERSGIRMRIDDGLIAGDRGALRIVCSYPNGKQVVEHVLITLQDGKIARWSGVLAWDD